MRMSVTLVVLALVVEGVGCASADTVSEHDRVMEGHLLQMADSYDGIATSLESSFPEVAIAVHGLAADQRLLAGQLRENHGPAEKQTPYTTENARAAAGESKKEHQTPWWQKALYAAGGILLAGLGIKYGDKVPMLGVVSTAIKGPWGAAAQVGLNLAASFFRRPAGQSPEEFMAHAEEHVEGAPKHVQTAVRKLAEEAAARIRLGAADTPPATT